MSVATIEVREARVADARLATGVRLRYTERGDAGGEPVILLHGYTDSRFSFSRLLPLLPWGWRVFALDQRGHGDSERPRDGYALRDFAADVVAFMDARGIERATLVGHCMGSLIAQQAALDSPERVGRLALVSPATLNVARNEAIEEMRPAVERLEDPVPAEFVREFQYSTAYRPLPEEFMERVVAESLKLPARVWRAVMEGMLGAENPARLREKGIPTLIVWGERDSIFSRAEQEKLAAALGGVELAVYTETGHSPHWERPEQVARDLESFFARTE